MRLRIREVRIDYGEMMIDNIKIEGYRAIEKLEISPKRINIFVGANNSGKSSILEFLSLLKPFSNLKYQPKCISFCA